MMKTPLPLLAASLLLGATPALFAADPDPALLAAGKARGVMTGSTGVKWIVSVTSAGSGGTRNAKFSSISQDGKILAEVIEPEADKDKKYLAESDGKMWFWKPGLSRPVSVSKRQRLSGDAAIGDIASTSYVDGYKVEGAEDGDG